MAYFRAAGLAALFLTVTASQVDAQSEASVLKTPDAEQLACYRKTDADAPLLIVVPIGRDSFYAKRTFEKVLCPEDTEDIEASYADVCRMGKAVSSRGSNRMTSSYGLSFAELCGAARTWLKLPKTLRVYTDQGKRVFTRSKGDPKPIEGAGQ